MTTKKDFSYLDYTSNKRIYSIMLLAGGLTISFLIGSYLIMNWGSEVYYYVTEQEAYTLGIYYTLGLIFALIGMIMLIHKLGGVAIKDIPSYWKWVKEEGSKKN